MRKIWSLMTVIVGTFVLMFRVLERAIRFALSRSVRWIVAPLVAVACKFLPMAALRQARHLLHIVRGQQLMAVPA